MEQDEKLHEKGTTNTFTEWQSPSDYGDGNGDIFNLQRLVMEQRKSPFPDIQFDILDNEDTDDNGCSYNVATGTKNKKPTRMDSWEDNWLFQQKKGNSRTATDGHSTLMSMRMYDTIDEQRHQDEKAESDVSDHSGHCKSTKVQRVERPCVRTSSSSSDAEDSEESNSSETPSRKSCSNHDDKVPFLESNPSTPGNSDSTNSNGQAIDLQDNDDVEDAAPNGPQHFSGERVRNLATHYSSTESQKRGERQYSRKMFKAQHVENDDSDDSIKDELSKHHEDSLPFSYSGLPKLPKLFVDHCHSPHLVSGTKSCTSEDTSSDEFEKKAAAYKGRRRASWCPLETSVAAKKRGKRRPPLFPLRLDDEEPELEIKPLAANSEALVGLERQMLRRDARHSSFRAKKASPNFVLNPLYVPEGEGGQDPRDPNHPNEPNLMQQLQPSKPESGYSSCSPDSMVNQNNMLFPQQERELDLGARYNSPSPRQHRLQSQERVRPPNPDDSFMW